MREDQARVQLKAAADAAATRGSLIFHLDLATALGSQALVEAGVDTGMLATVVDDDGYGVWALDAGGGKLAVARFAADGRPVVTHGGGPATRDERALASARRTMIAERLTGARETVVVVPRPRGAGPRDPFEAYALAQPERAGDVVLGIHWHATLSADGAQVLERTPLSRSPLVLPSRGPEAPPFDIEVTHFGAVPSEIHSWASLRHGIALSVLTLDSDLTWFVEGERNWLR